MLNPGGECRLQWSRRRRRHEVESLLRPIRLRYPNHDSKLCSVSPRYRPELHSAAAIHKYEIDDLRRGYDAQMSMKDSDGTAQTMARMIAATQKKSEAQQKAVSYMSAAAWGLFRKKKVVDLIDSVEAWNDKLQNSPLCGLCFGKCCIRRCRKWTREAEKQREQFFSTLNLRRQRLRIDAGLRLRNLILENSRTLGDYLKTRWTIGRLDEQPEMRTQRLTTPATDDGAPRSRAVFVEYKELEV